MTEVFILEFWLPFLLVFARTAAFISVIPFFSRRGIPAMLRIFFAFVLSVVLTLSIEPQAALPVTDLGLIVMLGKEIFAGLVLGFLVYLYFSVFLMTGQFMDHKAGLMMAGAFDPLFGSQVTLLGQFFYFLAAVFYLTVNGHHLLFLSLKESFTVIPLGSPLISTLASWEYLKIFAAMFLLAFQIAAPVIIVLWLMDLALGFLSKTVPQIHVFIVGLPLKVAFVLVIFVLMLPLLGVVMRDVFDMLARDFIIVMENW